MVGQDNAQDIGRDKGVHSLVEAGAGTAVSTSVGKRVCTVGRGRDRGVGQDSAQDIGRDTKKSTQKTNRTCPFVVYISYLKVFYCYIHNLRTFYND